MNGSELVLDADADGITADTDDTIHFKIGGNDELHLQLVLLILKTMVLNHS